MSNLPMWLVTALYAVQAGMALYNGQSPQALLISGYVVANLGLIWSMT